MSLKQRLSELAPITVGQEAAHNAVRSLHARSAFGKNSLYNGALRHSLLGIIAQMVDAEGYKKQIPI